MYIDLFSIIYNEVRYLYGSEERIKIVWIYEIFMLGHMNVGSNDVKTRNEYVRLSVTLWQVIHNDGNEANQSTMSANLPRGR